MPGGVGSNCDIGLPKEEPLLEKQPQNVVASTNMTSEEPRKSGKIFFLTLRQLECLAIMVVLAASDMVSLEYFGIFVFSAIYMCFLSKFAFPTNDSPIQQQPIFDPKSNILGFYIFFAAIIGLFLPILYIFWGILEGDKDGIKAAAPHLFLLTSQVFMEGISVWDCFSLPIRVFIPVYFNSCRLVTLKQWVMEEMMKGEEGEYGGSYSRLWVGRALAFANCALWFYNLFGFLLPVYLHKSFKRYYSNDGPEMSKTGSTT